jgi:hypothetical protein
MRDLIILDAYRVDLPVEVLKRIGVISSVDPKFNGAFVIEHKGAPLRIITAAGGCWDHVLISLPEALLAGPASRQQSSTLHLWRRRPKMRSIPLPPKHMV